MAKEEKDQKSEDSVEFEFDYDKYAKVSMAAQLQDIKLIGSKYTVKPEIFQAVEDLESMVHDFSGVCTGIHFDDDDGDAFGQFRWIAKIKSGRKTALKLSADFLVVYVNLSGQDLGHIEHFFNKVGRFATYPYFRALFSRHTSETGIMLPPLPSLNERVD